MYRKLIYKSLFYRFQAQNVEKKLVRLTAFLLILLVVYAKLMTWLEDMSFTQALWFTMTTITTVGYGDVIVTTASGRLLTVVFLYIIGIALLAQVVGLYFDFRRERQEKKRTGKWRWRMEGHIVFLDCSTDLDPIYFEQSVAALRGSKRRLARAPVLIVTRNFTHGLTDRLRENDVVYLDKAFTDPNVVESASLFNAEVIVIIAAKCSDPMSDSISFELTHRLREKGVKTRIIVEVVAAENRSRLKEIGANNVLRPIRAYPEMLIRSILAPGSERVIETLFDNAQEECLYYPVAVKLLWLRVVESLLANDVGLALACETQDGEIIITPPPREVVDLRGIFVIVKEAVPQRTEKEVYALLQSVCDSASGGCSR